MFYDERIENAKGRISRGAILMSFVISFVLGGIQLANIIRNAPSNKYYWFAVLEIAVCVGAMLVLTVGFVFGKLSVKDERTESAKSLFYSKAASFLIKAVLGLFAFVLPIALYIGTRHNFAVQGFGEILYVLLFIVGIYVVYSFRKNDIYFNYSIMDSESYYERVFKNIGKIALYTLAFLGISAVSFIGLVVIKAPGAARIVELLLDILAFYFGTLIEIALLYLLYSSLEKCSYNSEHTISKSTIISLRITILIYAAYALGVILIDARPISQANAIGLVSVISTLDSYIIFAFLIFLTYFEYEYRRLRKNRLLSAACLTVLLSEAVSEFIGQISGSLILVFMPEIMSQEAYIINNIFSTVTATITDAASLANLVGLTLIILALVKDKLIHKAHRFAPIAFALFCVIKLFLRTQGDALQINIYHVIVEIIVLCYFAFLAASVSKKVKKDTITFAQ